VAILLLPVVVGLVVASAVVGSELPVMVLLLTSEEAMFLLFLLWLGLWLRVMVLFVVVVLDKEPSVVGRVRGVVPVVVVPVEPVEAVGLAGDVPVEARLVPVVVAPAAEPGVVFVFDPVVVEAFRTGVLAALPVVEPVVAVALWPGVVVALPVVALFWVLLMAVESAVVNELAEGVEFVLCSEF